MIPRAGAFYLPQMYNLNKLGRDPPCDATEIQKNCWKTKFFKISKPSYQRLYLCDCFFFEQNIAENEDKNTHGLENNDNYS